MFRNHLIQYFLKLSELINKKIKEQKGASDSNTLTLELQEASDFGTLIYAKRYSNDEEKNKIEDGHRRGPYIVIGTKENYLICIYGTGKELFKQTIINDCFKTKPKYNGLSKKTYFYITNPVLIDKCRFEKKLDKLDKADKNLLKKKLESSDFYARNNIPDTSFKAPFELGDIISYNDSLYFIYNVENDKYTCLNISICDDVDPMKTVKIYDNNYLINFENLVYIDKNENIKRKITIENYTIEKIMRLYLYYIKSKSQQTENINANIERGSLVAFNKKIYYVYGEEGNNWLLFEIYNTKQNSDAYEIIINGDTYYTNFIDKTVLQKNNNSIFVIDGATEEEMDNIKVLKKDYKKNHKTKQVKKSKIYSPEITIGSIVNTYSILPTEYIVVYRIDTKVVITEKDKYENDGTIKLQTYHIKELQKCGKFDRNELKKLLSKIINNENLTYGIISKQNILKLKDTYL